MLGARHAPLDLQGLAEERFSLRVLPLDPKHDPRSPLPIAGELG